MAKRLVGRIRRWLRNLRAESPTHDVQIPSGNAKVAELILPLDYFGNYLNDKDLFVVPRELVSEVIAGCREALPDLVAYSRSMLNEDKNKPFLLLIGNLTDANMTSLQGELEMYEDAVKQYAPKGSTVLIKGHPLAVAPIAELLIGQLQTDYSVRSIPQNFSRYPIELWYDLVQGCNVISFSYSAISLRYLYNTPVIYALCERLIETHFRAEVKDFYKKMHRIYQSVLVNLAIWDGQSVLWKGTSS